MSKGKNGPATVSTPAVLEADGFKLYQKFKERMKSDESDACDLRGKQHERVPEVTEDIRVELFVQRRSFIKMGKLLCELYDMPLGYYTAGGYYDVNGRYKKFMAYCEHEFGLGRTSVQNYMGVAQRFGERDQNGKLTGEVSPAFEKYKYSHLSEMLPLEKLLPVTATVKQIREAKKLLRDEGQTSGLEKNPSGSTKKGAGEPEYVPGDPELRKPAYVQSTLPGVEFDKVYSFKNDEARDEFLKNYEKWPLWLDVPAVRLKAYRCKLSDGKYLYAAQTFYVYSAPTGSYRAVNAYNIKFYISDAEGFCLDSDYSTLSGIRGVLREDKLSAYLPLDVAEVPASAPAPALIDDFDVIERGAEPGRLPVDKEVFCESAEELEKAWDKCGAASASYKAVGLRWVPACVVEKGHVVDLAGNLHDVLDVRRNNSRIILVLKGRTIHDVTDFPIDVGFYESVLVEIDAADVMEDADRIHAELAGEELIDEGLIDEAMGRVPRRKAS